jgi:CheY-like chemotaxis protein
MARRGRNGAPKGAAPLLVLAASVSAADRHSIERMLKDRGFDVRAVAGAEEAEDEITGHVGPCVLVVDSGLLAMVHDGAWRDVRARHPGLGTVVRCLIARDPGVQRSAERAFLVHPDCDEGLLEAVRALATARAGD